MNRMIVVLMLAITFILSSSQLWITVSFYIHQDYIARVLCINRDKPGSDCKGSCQLKKRLEKDQKQKETSSMGAQAKEILVYFPVYAPLIATVMPYEPATDQVKEHGYLHHFPEGYYSSVFHPPSYMI